MPDLDRQTTADYWDAYLGAVQSDRDAPQGRTTDRTC
jgi:hypothetical protein